MDPLIHARVPFHFAAAWFPQKEISKGIDYSNRCEIKIELLNGPRVGPTRALQSVHSQLISHKIDIKTTGVMRDLDHMVTRTVL